MPQLDSESFTIWREIGRLNDRPVLEAAPGSEPGARVTVWPGVAPTLPTGVHPLLAIPLGQGALGEEEVWIEDRPPGVLLSDLDDPMSIEDAAQLGAQVADALGALHSRGHAHGQIQPTRVVLSLDGTPVLIGAGVSPGTEEDDLAALVDLVQTLCASKISPSLDSAAALAAGLRELALSIEASSLSLREQIECAMLPPPTKPQVIQITLTPFGYLDEVQPDLGPDERVRGLLDRWSNTDSNDEFTEDRTETISASELAAQGRRVMLERLGELYQRPGLSERFQAHEGTPCEPLKALIADTPLDPLPPPDGVRRPHAAIPEPETTVEVTQEAPALNMMSTDEFTGWTGAETTATRVGVTRILTLALIASLITLAGLAALATYLTYGVP